MSMAKRGRARQCLESGRDVRGGVESAEGTCVAAAMVRKGGLGSGGDGVEGTCATAVRARMGGLEVAATVARGAREVVSRAWRCGGDVRGGSDGGDVRGGVDGGVGTCAVHGGGESAEGTCAAAARARRGGLGSGGDGVEGTCAMAVRARRGRARRQRQWGPAQ